VSSVPFLHHPNPRIAQWPLTKMNELFHTAFG
jgi:hypothetical protein